MTNSKQDSQLLKSEIDKNIKKYRESLKSPLDERDLEIIKIIYEPVLIKYFDNDIEHLFDFVLSQISHQFPNDINQDHDSIYQMGWEMIQKLVNERVK